MNEKDNIQDNLDLTNLFENFIKPGVIVDEKEVVPGFKIKLKVLNVGELASAEAIMTKEEMPIDVVAKVRAAKILSQATLAINNVEIEKADMSDKDIRERRFILYKQFLELPAVVVQKSYAFYIECVKKQEGYYVDASKTQEELKNF